MILLVGVDVAAGSLGEADVTVYSTQFSRQMSSSAVLGGCTENREFSPRGRGLQYHPIAKILTQTAPYLFVCCGDIKGFVTGHKYLPCTQSWASVTEMLRL